MIEMYAKNQPQQTTKQISEQTRIAVVGPSLDILGGQGIQAAALIDALRTEGFDIEFIPVNPRFPYGTGWLRRIPYLRTILNQLLYRNSLKRIRNVELVHLFSASYWSFLLAQVPAIKAARNYGKKIVLNYHSGEAEDHLRNWGDRVHPWINKVDKIVVPSVYLKQVFARYGYATQVISNIINPAQLKFRKRLILRPKLLSIRNLEPIYRIENTLEAFALIKKEIPEATLTIAGYGSLETTLKNKVRDMELTDVEFIGRVEPSQIRSVYDQADIFINSSVVDNQPVSILEAFVAGLPVISTPTGDIANMIRDHENGLIVPQDNPQKLAEAILWLLANQHTAALMTAQAKSDVERYTWTHVRKQWIALFNGECK